MRSYFPIADLHFWFDLRIKFERSGKGFTFLLIVHLIIPKSFIIIDFFLSNYVGFKYFGHHYLGVFDLRLFNLFKSLCVSFDLQFEITNKLFKFLDGPVIDIDVFALTFNRSHVIHEAIRVDSSFKYFVSE